MATYFAITLRNGHWEYVTSGTYPDEVYQQAVQCLQGRRMDYEDDIPYLSPERERQLDYLRVVPEELAREHYHIVFPRALVDE